MKKPIKSIVFAAVMLSFFITVYSNSGPVFWQGYPSSEVMAVDENSPITVKSENLIFDFSDRDDNYHTISGKVTAAYKMANPTEKAQTVQMAFPIVESLDNLSPEDIVITSDDRVLPYDIYFGDVVDGYEDPRHEEKKISFDFKSIVSAITNEPYKAINFKENEKGKLYIIEVKPTAGQDIYFEPVFNLNNQNTKIFTTRFTSYHTTNSIIRVSALCDKPETFEIFVLGDDIDLGINAYTREQPRKKIEQLVYEVSAKELELKTYLINYIKENTKMRLDSMNFDTQLYNLYAKALDRCFLINRGYCSEYDLMQNVSYKRIMTLVYTVEFPPYSEKEISVSYRTTGTMDKRKTPKPLYTFDYIINPAKNWADFRNLNIKIIPPKEAPYVVKSSIELVKENNEYKATFTDLPEEDLSFTLYSNKRITILDKVLRNLQNSFGYFTPFVIGLIVFSIGLIVFSIGAIIVIIVLSMSHYFSKHKIFYRDK